MKSEFDRYINWTYVRLSEISYFCLEAQRFVKVGTGSDNIDKIEEMKDSTDELSNQAICQGNVDSLKKANEIDKDLDHLVSKLDIYAKFRNYLLN